MVNEGAIKNVDELDMVDVAPVKIDPPAFLLKRIIRKDPIKCDIVGDHWLHKVSAFDQMVLDAMLQSLVEKLEKANVDEESRKRLFMTGYTIGTAQNALRVGKEPDSAPVFEDFEAAFTALHFEFDKTNEIFELYQKTFDLTSVEKKSS